MYDFMEDEDTGFYNRAGERISMAKAQAYYRDPESVRVALSTVRVQGKLDLEVSTVFLVFDHRFTGKGPPLLFETMVFDSETGDGQVFRRYETEEEAVRGHNEVVGQFA